MADQTLEQNVNDPRSQQLAGKAKEKGFFAQTFSGIGKLALATGATALGLATVGPAAPFIGAALGGGSLLGSLYKKTPFPEAINNALASYTALNLVLQPMIALDQAIFPSIDNSNVAGVLGRTAVALGPYLSAFILAFRGASHLFNNYLNPKGITKTMFDNYWAEHKRLAWTFALGLTLATNGLGTIATSYSFPLVGKALPVFAPNALAAGFYNTYNPIKPKRHYPSKADYQPVPQPQPQYQPQPG